MTSILLRYFHEHHLPQYHVDPNLNALILAKHEIVLYVSCTVELYLLGAPSGPLEVGGPEFLN